MSLKTSSPSCQNRSCQFYRNPVSLIQHVEGYSCFACGTVSSARIPETFEKNVDFRNRDNYSKPTTVTYSSKAEALIRDATDQIRNIEVFKTYEEATVNQLIQATRRLINKIVEFSDKRLVYLPKDPCITTTAAILLAMDFDSPLRGHVHIKIIQSCQYLSKSVNFPSRVFTFRQTLLDRNILGNNTSYSEVGRWDATCDRLLNTLSVPFKIQSKIKNFFVVTVRNGWLNNSKTSYTLAAVFLHILFKGCTCYPVSSIIKKDLSEDEFMECLRLDLGVKLKPIYLLEKTLRIEHKCDKKEEE